MATRPRALVIAAGVVAVFALGAAVFVAACDGDDEPTVNAPHFVDDTAAAGIDHRYTGDFEHFVGGGVAAFDCDDDDMADLYFAGGTSPAALYRNESEVGGALKFAVEPSPVTDLTEVNGAYPLDVDSDGVIDLVVLRYAAGNVLLRGLGDCRFEDATAAWGIEPGDAWTVAFSAAWEGDNALPTLAFGNYLVPGTTPDNYACGDNQLLRPDSSAEAYDTPIAMRGHCTLSMLFSDWGRTGERDLRVSNDRHYYVDGQEQLWEISADAAPREYSDADGWRELTIYGMGIASQDITGDGRPEVYLTSQGDNKLQTLDDGATGPTYHDIALELGATAHRPYTGGDVLPSTAWHPQFDDVNNDGHLDLLVTKGNVEAQVEMATKDPNNLLLGRADGTFVEGAEDAGIVRYDRGRGAAIVDLNLDGLLDLVIVNRVAPATIWRNAGSGGATAPAPMGHWLGIRLEQPAPNVDAIGAWIEVKVGDQVLQREVTVGGGHASGQLVPVHFGLGDAEQAEVRVQWPNGDVGPWIRVDADQVVTVAP